MEFITFVVLFHALFSDKYSGYFLEFKVILESGSYPIEFMFQSVDSTTKFLHSTFCEFWISRSGLRVTNRGLNSWLKVPGSQFVDSGYQLTFSG